jgi:hypothetical protein
LIAVDTTIADSVITEKANNIVNATVNVIQKGSESISGSFSLSYNDESTIDLPYDASSDDVKAALEDTGVVGSVTVVRSKNLIDGLDRGAYTWTVTFNSLGGNLPLIQATSGRLGPVASHVSILVEEIVSGTDANLIYDGIGNPSRRSVNVIDLVTNENYAFKVVPITAIGEGILSGASATVTATGGASASASIARGTALTSGIVDSIHEVQKISATD